MGKKKLFAAEVNLSDLRDNLLDQSFFREDQLPNVLQSLYHEYDEVLIISTSERFAVYTIGPSATPLVNAFSVCPHLAPHVYYMNTPENIIYHFFATTSGLYTRPELKTKLLAEVNTSYQQALDANCIGLILYNIVQDGIRLQSEVEMMWRANTGKKFYSAMEKKEKAALMVLNETLKFTKFLENLNEALQSGYRNDRLFHPEELIKWQTNSFTQSTSGLTGKLENIGLPFNLCNN